MLPQGQRDISIVQDWNADPTHQDEELNFDIADWPPQADNKPYALHLEDTSQHDIHARIRSRKRNLARMEAASKRKDVVHIGSHFSCYIDQIQCKAIEKLLNYDDREWISFTMVGINGTGDLYSSPSSAEYLYSFFLSLTKVKVLNLRSCTSCRGHGLEIILKTIPYFDELKELRLEGWQMDRVSVVALVESLKFQHTKSVLLLSMRSCLFLGEETFHEFTSGVCSIPQLETLNLSHCNLGDNEIIPLVDSMKRHPSIRHVHLGGNFCRSQDSVLCIAAWINDSSCNLYDLNVRSLWIGFSEEGLVQRYVNLEPVFDAISKNESLRCLSISANYLEDKDVQQLTLALLASPNKRLHTLDIRDNPFEESGADSLFEIVCGVRSLHAIQFENHFFQYRCTDLLKLHAEFNLYDTLLVDKAVDIPIPLWPRAFSRVQEQETANSKPNINRTTNVLYRLLQSPSGPFGDQLLLKLATHRKAVY